MSTTASARPAIAWRNFASEQNRNIPHPNYQGLSSLVYEQIRHCSAEHVSGTAFRTASIPETHLQCCSIKADQPN
jgi:hypothetical protein